MLFLANSFIFCLYQVTWKKYESLLFNRDVAQIFKILIMKFMLLEIVVSYQFIHILLISGSLEKKHEALLFRGDAIQIFKILIMKFMLLEIVVSCPLLHILFISCIDIHADMDTRLFPVHPDHEDTSVLTV